MRGVLNIVGDPFAMVRDTPPSEWDLDAMYRACHAPIEAEQHVVIVVPEYHEDSYIARVTNPSREAVADDLKAHGIACSFMTPPPDSHVDRMRQRATHQALKHGATHMLWWDLDIECMNPTTVRAMMVTGHDVVAGACPFKNMSGRVVCNVRPEDEMRFRAKSGTVDLPGGCIEVHDAGTGFMMVTRKTLLSMMQHYNELVYLSRGEGDRDEPLWALWDASLVGAECETWTETLASRGFDTEDYYFCRLWQAMGGKVHIFVPATFRHWGLHPFEGSFVKQWGLEQR